jgi:hypothetical protein
MVMRTPKDAAETPPSSSDAQALSSGRDPELKSSGTHRAPPTEAASGPLGARDLELLARAGERMRSLRRALWLAYMNGSTLLLCGFACVPFALFDASLLLPALVLCASGAAELRGARMLRDHDLRAPRWLASNQLVLLALVAAYCAFGAYRALHASVADELSSAAPDATDQLRDMMPALDLSAETLDRGYRTLVVAFYAAVFAACALYQGLCARYYRTRAAVLRAFLDETPAWVMEVQRRLNG